jgi:uncharacterized protein with HEPN domain
MPYCKDPIRLQHMLNYIREVLDLIQGRSRNDLNDDRLLGLAAARLLEMIGAEAAGVSSDYQTTYTAIPWSQLSGFRNLLAQGYDAVDPEILWEILSQDLPALVPELQGNILRLSAT